MSKRLIAVLLVLVLAFTSIAVVYAQDSEVGPVTQRIIDRGSLVCGINSAVQGFSFVDDAGEASGLDVDVCRAVAVAVLGDAEAVEFRPVVASERQATIQSGEIDMMSRNTTWTLSRDATWTAIFAPTTFYDGQAIGTRTSLGISTGVELDGASMCVQAGTTTELNITDWIESNGLDIELVVLPDTNSTWEAFSSEACEAWTTDLSGIAAFHSTSEDPGEFTILPDVLSKEPLGPLSPQEDPQFAEIVAWVVFGLIQAEEFGISSENVGDFLDSEDPAIQRFLGQGDNATGTLLGISNDFMVSIIEQVGNYGEIYDRNIVPLGIEREGSLNALWTEGGLHYSPPFR